VLPTSELEAGFIPQDERININVQRIRLSRFTHTSSFAHGGNMAMGNEPIATLPHAVQDVFLRL
jgi:hypothetical protein